MAEQAFGTADDRNLTADTYNESIAAAISTRLPRHLAKLEAWLQAMRRGAQAHRASPGVDSRRWARTDSAGSQRAAATAPAPAASCRATRWA